MATIASLVVKVQADVADVQKNVAKVQSTLGGLEKTVHGVGKALVGMIAVGSVTRAVSQYVQFASKINDLSAKAGMGVEAFQKLSYAAKINGGSMEQVAQGATRLSRNLVEGQKSTVGAVGALGLKLSDLKRMDPADAFMKIGDAISKIPNPMQQSALAMQLFGRAGADYLPMFKGNMQAAAEEAQRLGIVLSRDVIDAADTFGDRLDLLKLSGMAVLSKALTPMLPALIKVAEALSGVGNVIIWLQKRFSDLIAASMEWAASAFKTSAAYMNLLRLLPGDAGKVAAGLTGGFAQQAQWFSDAAKAQRLLGESIGKIESAAPVMRQFPDIIDAGGNAAKRAATKWDALADGILRAAEAAQFASYTVGNTPPAGHFRYGNIGRLPGEEPWTLPEWSGRAYGMLETPPPAMTFGGIPSQFTRPDLLNTPPPGFNLFGGALSHLGPTVLQALTGGGNLAKSVGGLLGGGLFDKGSTIGKAITGKIGSWLGGAVGSIIPGLGTLLGGVLGGGITKLFGGLFGPSKGLQEGRAADAQIADLKAGLLATYGTLDNIRKMGGAAGAALADAWGSKNVAGLQHITQLAEEFKAALDVQSEIDALKGQLAELEAQQIPTWDKVKAAVDRYGGSIDSLGQKIQQLAITDAATTIVNDWETLIAAGGDANAIASMMSKQINQLVADSIRFGSELPANMKPVIQSLIDQGLLFDAAGQKITDVAALKWGAPIVSEADKITAAIEALIQKIEALVNKLNGVSGAEINIPVNYTDPGAPVQGPPGTNPQYWEPDTAHLGGFVTRTGIKYFSRGGWNTWRPQGTDIVPAMLTPGELVLNSAQQRRIAAALGGGSSSSSGSTQQTIIVQLDGREIARVTAKNLPSVLRIRGAA